MRVRQEPLVGVAQQKIQMRPLTDRDNRAEGNRRTVHFDNDCIIIMRRIHGMSMRVSMPVRTYDGVGILLPNPAEGYAGFRVMLVHADPDLSVRLFEDCNPAMVEAAVSEWSQFFALPALPALHGTAPAAPVKTLGAVQLGQSVRWRRRGGTLAKRRPRLYARRKTGNPSRMNVICQGEREIIAPD